MKRGKQKGKIKKREIIKKRKLKSENKGGGEKEEKDTL